MSEMFHFFTKGKQERGKSQTMPADAVQGFAPVFLCVIDVT